MRVTRLEIFGFKSFVERFVLNFDRNMIGIVGPNGCGKSNVVDALRWVLGETYAKQLRGTAFDDLIFNGSESRRPLGMAEVSITIRPTDGWASLLEPHQDQALDQKTEGATSPTDEVSEDADGNTESSDESSGQDDADGNRADSEAVDGGLELATEELPELAGLTPEEAAEVPELKHEPAIFTEIPGLLGAAEIQFTRRLYRSGESEYFINRVPCRLRDMTDIYRLIGLGARGLSIVQQGEIGALISKKPLERRELLEEAAGISGFRTRMEAAQRRLEKTAENMARLRDIILEVEKQVRVLQRQAKRARDRNEIKAELKEYEYDLYAARATKITLHKREQISVAEHLDEELERVRSELAVIEATQGELQSSLEAFEIELSDRRRDRDQLQQVLNNERNRVGEIKLELARVGERLGALGKSLVRIDERTSSVSAEIERRTASLSGLESKLGEVQLRRAAAEQALTEVQQRGSQHNEPSQLMLPVEFPEPPPFPHLEELRTLQGELEQLPAFEEAVRALDQTVRTKEKELRAESDQTQKKRVRFAGLQSELRALNEQLEALAEHITKVTDAPSDDSGLSKVLLAGMRLPEELQRAVSAILGEKAQYLVTPRAQELGENYSRNTSGSTQKLGVIDLQLADSVSTGPLDDAELEAAPSARQLLSSITVEPSFERVVSAFLGTFVVVDTFAEALRLNELQRSRGNASRSIVTLQGEVIQPWGWYTTEGKGGAFSFTRRIAEKEEQTQILQSELSADEDRLSGFETSLQQLKQELIEQQEQRERLIGVQRRVSTLRREEQEHERRIREAQLAEERRIRDAQLAEERRRREALAAEEREAQAKLRQVIAEQNNAERELEFERRKISDLEQDIRSLANQKHHQLGEHQKIEQKREELEHALSHGGAEGGLDMEKIQAQCKALEEEIRDIDEQRNPVRMQLAEQSEIQAGVRRELNQFQEQRSKTELALEKCEIELRMVTEEVLRQYPEAVPPTETEVEAIQVRAEGDIDAFINELSEEAGKLRRRIEREGDVDPQSIELYEQEDARLNGMKTQYADLEQASSILTRTVRQLKDISRARFLATFKTVSEKFSELVPRLFGGGAGQLQLVNPDDPLESGVEIFVRPPGKKVTNMELLSGGEKALVAVSVLIAMFLHRPSPICVLDEVDAPLDEANLERFLGLISEISSKTQFLMITHNKRSMVQAQRLIGITMQERGVSTALTVSLEESEQEIDRWIANA
ncbi:MAG: AAA family ATPase [Bdellovibrionota bacterium]